MGYGRKQSSLSGKSVSESHHPVYEISITPTHRRPGTKDDERNLRSQVIHPGQNNKTWLIQSIMPYHDVTIDIWIMIVGALVLGIRYGTMA